MGFQIILGCFKSILFSLCFFSLGFVRIWPELWSWRLALETSSHWSRDGRSSGEDRRNGTLDDSWAGVSWFAMDWRVAEFVQFSGKFLGCKVVGVVVMFGGIYNYFLYSINWFASLPIPYFSGLRLGGKDLLFVVFDWAMIEVWGFYPAISGLQHFLKTDLGVLRSWKVENNMSVVKKKPACLVEIIDILKVLPTSLYLLGPLGFFDATILWGPVWGTGDGSFQCSEVP